MNQSEFELTDPGISDNIGASTLAKFSNNDVG